MTERLRLSIADGVARLTLAAPGRRNAIDLDFCTEWERKTQQCAATSGLKLVVLAAEGPMFSVGGDLAAFVANADTLDAYIGRCIDGFHAGIRHLRDAPAPVLLLLGGVAAGGAFSLVCGADMVVAHAGAKLVSGYTKTGLTPDGGLTWLLPHRIGPARAFDIIATNRPVDAEEAAAIGLVARVHQPAAFEAECDALVALLGRAPAGVLAALKRLLSNDDRARFDAQLDAERAQMIARARLPETIASLRAFLSRA